MKKNIFLFTFSLFNVVLFAQNELPIISNVQATLDAGTNLIITYDLADAEADEIDITFRATKKGTKTFDYDTQNAVGDVGTGIIPGTGKMITWDYSAFVTNSPNFRILLVANDLQSIDIQSIVDQVDSLRLKGDLAFVEGPRHRITNPQHLAAVQDSMESLFHTQNLDTYRQTFMLSNYEAANIIGRKIGTATEGEVYILDGHFDTVSNSPGVDDNGTAIVGVMEAARLLAPYSFKKTIQFIGFDLEEEMLNGSFQYVGSGIDPAETIKGVLNFEMIGYYTTVPNTQSFPAGFELLFPDLVLALEADEFRGNFILNVGEANNSMPIFDAYNAAAAQYVPDLKVLPLATFLFLPDLLRSDHAPFWLNNLPAVMLTNSAEFRNPNYHTANDTLGSINFTFMTNVVKAAVATLAEVAEIQHATTFWMDTDFPTSVQERWNCAFDLMPNPVTNEVRLHFGNCQILNLEVQLFDLNGRQVFLKKINPSHHATIKIDLPRLVNGVYILRLEDGERSITERLIISNP